MKFTLYNARLIDPASETDIHGGITVEDGIIQDVGPHLATLPGAMSSDIDCNGHVVAPGLIDLRVKTGEPGSEHRETLQSASQSAVAGGITSMVVMPETDPVIDTPALVDYLRRAGQSSEILNHIYPAGAISVGLKGESMSEIGLMKKAGAILFSNVDQPLPSTGMLRKVMQYAKGMGVVLMLRPDEPSLASGVMNAGAFASRLGLSGMAPHAEWMGLQRDLILAEMTGANVIVDQISTARSLQIIENARKRRVNCAVSVAAHHLIFNELDIGDGSQDPRKAYLTYCKVNPPFRAEDDRLAMIEGIRSGQIDCVTSAHDPQPPEEKRLPFEEASFGAAGLETLLSALTSVVAEPEYELSLMDALRTVTIAPAELLDLPQGRLETGRQADIVRFNPDTPWKCTRDHLRSRSRNSPFDGRLMTGQVQQTFVSGQCVFDRLKA